MDKTVLLLVGPTASGKTEVSLKLAQYFQTSIISADSRQCFIELNIGVAKPSLEELRTVPHFFINSHTIGQNVNAGLFERLALQWSTEIFNDHDLLVMVGGTGLYIKAFCEGLNKIPPVDESIRSVIQLKYEENGLEWLQEEIRLKDPEFFSVGEMMNPQRMMRALEVVLSTDRSILSFRNEPIKRRPFRIIKYGLQLTREELYRNINFRTDKMIELGLLEEVKKLLPYAHLNALQSVGYNEIFSYLNATISFEKAVELIKKNTRNYAKRQMTWFSRDKSIQWINPGEWDQIKKIADTINKAG
ncbi:MAG TPA: tRNA (adenosine(37)-N6)-dimethylallyltransferase MiaA [Puia sp.]|nr:tRNA (adenosine(37)-N6)-dimethylallyltransferase MiaA [Puia sp.]